jgi:NitT/TauT family transport system substrate-binding protein
MSLGLACSRSTSTGDTVPLGKPGSGEVPALTAPQAPADASTNAAPAQIIKSKVAYTTIAAGNAPVWVALEGGYFREQGLDVELVNTGSGAPVLAALQNREVDVGTVGGPVIVTGYIQGLETMLVGNTSVLLDGFVVGGPAVQRPEDLRGKTIGVSRLKSVSDFGARLALQRIGLQPDVDVHIRGTGGNAESLAALEIGSVDAVSFGVPTVFEARKRGYHVVVDGANLNIPFLQAGVTATKRVINEQPSLVEAYIRAFAQADSRLRTDREYGAAIVGKYSQMDDREILLATIDYYQPLFLTDVTPNAAALQTVIDLEEHPAARTLRPEEVIDARFTENLRRAGFFERLPQ